MATSRELSTISYNTIPFLIDKLNDLHNRHIIIDWFFIKHFHEPDEGKDHIHLWIKPNVLIDIMDLQDEFKEYLPGEDKPRKCIDWNLSKRDDALLYFLHDPTYLDWKKESRKYHYDKKEMYVCDDDQFEISFHHAFYESEFAQALRDGDYYKNHVHDGNLASLVYSGQVKLSLAPSLLALDKLDRNGRTTHTPIEKSNEDN